MANLLPGKAKGDIPEITPIIENLRKPPLEKF